MKDENRPCCHKCEGYYFKKIFHFIYKRLTNQLYNIFHIMVLLALTFYVILNWDTCITMQFFSNFDGNNILFIMWLVLIFLIIYEVEGKGVKLSKNRQKKFQENLNEAKMIHDIESAMQQIKFDNSGNTGLQKERMNHEEYDESSNEP